MRILITKIPRIEEQVVLLCAFAVLTLAAQAQTSSSTWGDETSLPIALQEVAVTQLNGQVYLAGGDTQQGRSQALYVYDLTTRAWTTRAPYPGDARDHIGIASIGQSVYILGGILAWPTPSVSTVQRYDPASNSWSAVAPLPLPRAAMAVASLNGKIYAAGGLRDGAAVNDFTAYDPATNSWVTLPPLPTARDHVVGVALNNRFYAIGGRPGADAICAPVKTVDVYDPLSNSWSSVAPLATARAGHAAGTINGRIQVFGGEGGAGGCGVIASAEEYDPATNAWVALPSMPTPRHGTGGATIGNSIFLPGGAVSTGHAPTTAHDRFEYTIQSEPSTAAFLEQSGQVVIEAEHYHQAVPRSGRAWTARTDRAGYSGASALVAEPDSGGLVNTAYAAAVPELQYQVQFTAPGTYFVWVRALPDDDNNNSLHVGLNGVETPSADRISTTSYGAWSWFQGTLDGPVATVSVPSAGTHTINVWMREDGFRLDRLLLTSSAQTVPSGAGPAESPRAGGTPPPPPPPTGSLPSPWITGDVGAVGAAGSASYANGTFTVKGAGEDIWGNADAFHFTYQALNGDQQIVARVAAVQNTHPNAKGGVMIRESLAAGARHAIVNVTPGAGLEFMRRLAPGGATSWTSGGSGTAPKWVKLVRQGQTFSGYTSVDGTAWQLVGTDTISMASTVYVGLAVTSHDTAVLATSTFDSVSVSVPVADPPPPPPSGLPTPWVTADVGTVGVAGSASYANGTFTVKGAGHDIWGSADAFHFTYQALSGDRQIVARVAAVQNTHPNAKGGVMIRESLAAGARHAIVNVTPGNGLEFMRRLAPDGATSWTSGGSGTAPKWVKLVRQGQTFSGYTSVDGTAWQLVGTDTISMASTVYVGLAVTSHDTAVLATSTFDSVSVSVPVVDPPPPPPSGLPTPWVTADVGDVGLAGSATYGTGTFTVKGAGDDIWGSTDAFRFAYRPVSGDQEIIARVASLQNTHPNAKAGVMIRESLDPGARHALINVTPGVGVEFLRRLSPGAPTAITNVGAVAAPQWVKLVRQGNAFSAFTSADGQTWQLVGYDTIAMATSVYGGLAVTSHDRAALATATFDTVSVAAPPPGAPIPPITPSSLTDTFDDNLRDTAKWYRGALTYYGYVADENGEYQQTSDMLVRALEQNGRLEIFPRVNATGLRYNGYASVGTFDFAGKHASVQVVQAPNASGTADLVFSVVANPQDWYRFHVVSGSLHLEATVGGATTAVTVAYSATQHKFWRLRHDGAANTIVWETSADRSSWVVQRTATLGISLASVRIELVSGTHQKESQPGIAIFDTFRLEPDIAAGVNKPPIADAGGPYTGAPGQPVQFSGSASYDPDGTIAQYEWNFGDGTTATGATVTHTYASAGVFNAVLKVTDGGGATTSASAKTTQNTPAIVGQWSRPVDLPVVAVHASVMPNGRVMMWQHESTSVPYLWDPVANNGVFDPVPIHSNQGGTRRDSIYCAGHSFLPDGRLFAAGGHLEPKGDTVDGSRLTNIFDVAQTKWSSGPDMNDGRWYPSNVTLGDGSTLVLSGSIDDNFADQGIEGYAYRVNELPQVYEANGQFRSLTSALLKLPLYLMAYLGPNGKVFIAGPAKTTRYLDTSGTGAWTVVGDSNFGNRTYGASVMYDPGKVVLAGGNQDAPTDSAEVIDLNAASPTWRYVGSMAFKRARATGTVLPDGKVLIGGGHSTGGFSPGGSAVMTAELWDPATEQWSKMADAAVARLHHSGALLLPDARVLFLGGGQPTGDGDYEHYDGEFYSPPYLFKGSRPTITSAPASVGYGQTFAVDTADVSSITQVTWIRLPSVTHQFNQNQGINRLSFTKTPTGLTVTAPSSGNLAPPGPYMLFVLNGNGVPSVAKIVRLDNVAPPLAPGNLTGTAASATQIDVNWTDASTNEAGFKIERCEGSTCTNFAEVAQTAAGVTTYSNLGLTASTTYRYRVRAFNTGGDSAYSNVASATTPPLPPAAPTNLTAAAASSTATSLTWTDTSANETGFRIERCQGAGCTNFAEVAQVAANIASYNDTGLSAGTTYSYRVRAFNSGGTSTYSNTATATTTPSLGAPLNLTATAVSSTQVALSWTDNSAGEEGFRIERCQGTSCTNFVQIAQTVGSATSYDDTGLTAGTAYTYRVRAYAGGGTSPYSNSATVTTAAAAPTAPGNLSATAVSSTQINLAWVDASSDESGFKVERCTGAACTEFVQVAQVGVNATTYGDMGVAPSTAYTYRVRAFNGNGGSAYSNTASAITPEAPPTPPTAPGTLTATADSSSQITLRWEDSSVDESGFKVERCAGVDCTTFVQVAQTAADITTYGDSALLGGTSYTYRVRAYNGGGDSAYSNTATAATPVPPPSPPAAPTNLTATAVSSSQIDVAWTDAASNEAGFKVERCAGSGCTTFVEVAQPGANTTSYSDNGRTADTTYTYRVRAYNAAGHSSYAGPAEARTPAAPPPPPAAPTSLTLVVVSATQIDLGWADNSSDETSFTLERCKGAACADFVQIAEVAANVTSYANTNLQAGTSYTYRVRAHGSVGDSAYSNQATASTEAAPPDIPSAPANLAAQVVSASRIDLSWADNSTNEEGFLIERCLGSGCTDFAQIAQTATGVVTFSSTGLQANTTYSYRVRAYNAFGQSGYTNTVEARTQEAPLSPPAAPTNLAATAVSSTQIDLTWTDASTNESSFSIERCMGAGCTNFVEVGQVAANLQRYGDTGLVGSTTYTYRIRAVNSGGSSPYSNSSEATTPPVPPAAPTTLTASAVSSTQVNLTWTDSASDEAGFRIERCEGSACTTFAEIAQTAANVTTYSDPGRTPSTSYTYRVRAFNAGGSSGYSNSASATTTAAAPSAPSSLTATAVSSTQITLGWVDTSANEDGFRLERCQGVGCANFAQVAQVAANATGYTDAGLAPGTSYTYRVRAFNSGGDSAYSASASATTAAETPPAAPTNLVGSAGPRRIDLQWTDNAGNETGFRVERSTDGTTFVQIASVGADVTAYRNSGLTANTLYYYRVRAYNAQGNSAYSNVVQVRTK